MRPNQLALALLAGAMLVTSACVASDEDTVILILQNNSPTETCEANVDPSGPFIARGVADTTSVNGYMISPIVQNSASSIDTTANKLFLMEGADIDLTPQGGFFSDAELAQLELSFSQRFSGVIQPDGGITFVVFEILSTNFLEAVGAKLPADGTKLQVKASIQIFGQMHGGGLKSQKFDYWVDVCNGCLTPVDLGSCDTIPEGYVAGQGSCWGQQDALLECCTDANSNVICPATVPSG